MMKKTHLIVIISGLLALFAVSQNVALDNKKVEGAIEQPQMDGGVIAAHYREWTGKRVIVSNAAQGKAISFIQPGPLTYSEASELLEKACLLEGMVFVPSGENEVKLVLAENVRQQGVPFLNKHDPLPDGDQVVSYFMQLEHLAPGETMQAFESIIGKVKGHGSITVVENANALVITENTALIRTLIDIKNAIDIPKGKVETKMVELVYADAEVVRDQLDLILQSQVENKARVARVAQVASAPNSSDAGAPGDGARRQATSSQPDAGDVKKVNVSADTRTNSIYLVGRPVDILLTESIIRDFDQPAKTQNFYSFRLKYLPVGEFLPVAADAIKRVSDISGSGGNSSGRSSSSASRTSSTGASSSSNGGNRGSSLAESERDEVPQTQLVGKTHLVADSTNNTLIVEGPPQSLKIITNLIEQMDIPARQVQITAIFGRYTMDGEKSFGVDFARTYQNRGSSGIAGQSGTGFPTTADPSALNSPTAFPVPANGIAGLALYGNVGQHFFSYLRALESSGRFKLLARPTLFTTNNRKAVLSSGQRIAVPTSTLSQQALGGGNAVSQNTNIEFRDVLLKLEVIPLVNSNDEVTLKISFLNDNVVGSQTINGNSIPTIGTEELYTTVKVPNNGTIVLGGLITEQSTDNKTGVPILSRIPGIGKIFSSTTKVNSKEELVILIKPKIIDGPADLAELQRENAEESKIFRDIHQQDTTVSPAQSGSKAGVISSPRDRFRGRRR